MFHVFHVKHHREMLLSIYKYTCIYIYIHITLRQDIQLLQPDLNKWLLTFSEHLICTMIITKLLLTFICLVTSLIISYDSKSFISYKRNLNQRMNNRKYPLSSYTAIQCLSLFLQIHNTVISMKLGYHDTVWVWWDIRRTAIRHSVKAACAER